MKTIRQLDYMGGTVKVDEIKEINFNETGDIIDTLSGISLKDTPEERVRQRFIGILQTDYGYPKANFGMYSMDRTKNSHNHPR